MLTWKDQDKCLRRLFFFNIEELLDCFDCPVSWGDITSLILKNVLKYKYTQERNANGIFRTEPAAFIKLNVASR